MPSVTVKNTAQVKKDPPHKFTCRVNIAIIRLLPVFSVQPAQKKGFGLVKAATGGILLGGVGLLGGVIGSGKINITCLQYGHSWKASKL